ncbi:MAG TPA: tryptophan-rich sensory protein [Synergistales bacterium]|nr:hypothetical protein [Synergistaceae bacterium]HQQ10075.1 tryptophan-rich sensory protein [Synergistales bacterium]
MPPSTSSFAPGANELVLLWAAIAVTIRAFARVDRIAAWLMVPYIASLGYLWVTYAGALNASL